MNDEDDPIVKILKGENINFDSEYSDNKNNEESKNELTKEKNTNENNDLSKTENNSKDNKKIENKFESKDEKLEEKVKKKSEGENAKKIDEFFPKNLSPLDFVNYIEVERTSGNVMDEMQNFLLENYMKKNNKYEVLETKTLSQINSEISEIDIKLFYTKKNLLLFYTQNGNILALSLQKQKFLKKLMPKNVKNSSINCLDITDDLSELICGYQDGSIEIINIQSGDSKYINNKIHKDTACIELKIYKKEKNEIFFLSSGNDGKIFYNKIKIGLPSLLWRINSTPVLTNKNEFPIYLIKIFDKNLNLNENYAIFGSVNEISVYCLEPTLEKLFTIQKPNFINETIVPDAQVGFGRLSNEKENNILLIISWSNIVYFYYLEIKEKIINSYNEIGNYINKNNILRIGFINSSVVYIIDESLSIKIIDTKKINKGKISFKKQKLIIPSENSFAEIEQNHFICPFIFSQEKIFDNKKKPLKTYLYSIVENNFNLYIYGQKQLYNVKLYDWINYLNTFKKKEEYLNLFSIGVKLYKNDFQALSNIPNNDEAGKKKINDVLRQIISQYVIFNTDEKKNLDEISQAIKLTIEFCINIEAVEYLLNSIEPIIEAKEYCKLFLEKFTPFVLRDKIVNLILPCNTILNLFDLYDKNLMNDYLSHILLHMNIKSLDNRQIKDKMEELNLITPLLYLYSNGEKQDYLGPLQKMFNNYTKLKSINDLLNEEESNEIDYGTVLNNKRNLTLEKIINSKEYNGHRILWYIRWILTGKKFLYEEKNIEKDIFIDLVPKITYWLLSEAVIKEFLEFDPKNYFMIHKNIFSSKYLYDILVKSSNDSKTKISNLVILLNEVYKLNDIHPLSLIDYMIAWCKYINNKKIYFYLYDFIISISKIDNIKKDIKIEAACYILKNYNDIVRPINRLNVEYLNLKIINFLQDKENMRDNDYKKIMESIINDTFDEVKLFLYNQFEDYKKSIEFMLEEKNNIKNRVQRLFEFLNTKTDELIYEKDKYNKLLKIIKDNIINLARLSLKDFYDLCKKLFWDEKKEILKKLSKDKSLQYNLLEMIIQSFKKINEEGENAIELDEDDNEEELKYLLELQIKLLCDLKKFDDIVPTLKKSIYYPLKDCFNYCKEAGAYEACIYLYLKEGNYEKALKLSCEKLNEVFLGLTNNINGDNNEEKHKELLNNFDKYLNDSKKICEDNLQEDLWFELLQILYDYEKKSEKLLDSNKLEEKKNILSQEINQKMIQEIKDLLERMSSYVSISRIIEVVTEKNENAGFKEFRELLIKILNNYDNLSSILLSARRLLTNLVLENEYSYQSLILKGELLHLDKCDKCHKVIDINEKNKGEILAFLCNHCYHKTCVTQYKRVYECPICRELEIGELEVKGKSLVKRDNIVVEDTGYENKQVQVNVNVMTRKMIMRLNKFDTRIFANRKILTDSIEA